MHALVGFLLGLMVGVAAMGYLHTQAAAKLQAVESQIGVELRAALTGAKTDLAAALQRVKSKL